MQMVKMVGTSGQVSLGKEYAGRLVLIDQVESGVWVIKLGEFVPDNELWMMRDGVKQKIDQAVAWARDNRPAATDLEALEKKVSRP